MKQFKNGQKIPWSEAACPYKMNEKKEDEQEKKKKRIKCRGCGGFGHIQAEHPKIQKKKGKPFIITWSNEEPEGS